MVKKYFWCGLLVVGLFSGCARIQNGKLGNGDCKNPDGCKSTDWRVIRELIESVPSLSSEFSESRDTILSQSRDVEIGFNQGEPTYQEKELHESVSTFEQLVAFDPNSDVLWPGAAIQGRSLQSGLLIPIPLKHAPSEITITNLTLSKESVASKQIEKPSHATVNQAIHQIVTQEGEIHSSAKASYVIKEMFSLEQGLNQIGISSHWLGGEARAVLDSNNYKKKNNFIVKFTQNYFTASYEPPKSPEAIFSPDTKYTDVAMYVYSEDRNTKKVNNPPMYISSVNYGRTLVFVFSSSLEKNIMKASLEAMFNGSIAGGKIELNTEEGKMLQLMDSKVLVLGGGGAAMAKMLSGNKTESINRWIEEGANYSSASPGVPISYTVRYLKDYDVARMSFTTQYEVTRSRTVPIKSFDITFNTLDDDKDFEEPIDVWLTKDGEILFEGSFGRSQTWSDGEIHKFTFPVQTEYGLNGCQGMKLRVHKRPTGSRLGCGWNMALNLSVKLEHGRSYSALRAADQQGMRWGDDSDYDRTFDLVCH